MLAERAGGDWRPNVQHGIEMILMRRLASRLTMPILLVDAQGDLAYFNHAAASVLGRRLEDTEPIARDEWMALFRPADVDGRQLKREEVPLLVATDAGTPSWSRGSILGLDGVVREIEGVAFPLIGHGDRMLGVVAMFWDCANPPPPGVPHAGGPLDLASPGGDRPLELLLMRQLASCLKTVIALVGPDGSLLFYNEPAERLVGRRFDEADAMSAEEWSALLQPLDEAGRPIDTEERPMIVALRRQLPAHRRYSIRGFDRVLRAIEGLAFPLVGGGRQLGAVGIFWERAG